MKRVIALCILASLLLVGCGGREDTEFTADFYYLRDEIAYGGEDGVIACETREIPGGELPLTELLALYMKGPAQEGLSLPLSAGTRLTEVTQSGDTLILRFTMELSYLDGMDLSLACACISRTCFSLTDAETIRIYAPAAEYGVPVSMTVSRDTFLLFDDTTEPAS